MLSRVLASKVETNKKNLPNQDDRRKVAGGGPFKNYKFFLDIKSRYPASLVPDIEYLGGVSFSIHFNWRSYLNTYPIP